jgi:uncharacterized MnhB-related membrane protein
VQVAIVVGFAVLLAALDWIIKDSPRTAIAAAVGAVIGLVVHLVRRARQAPDRS